jgi:Flp pilus assembly pilin Flp
MKEGCAFVECGRVAVALSVAMIALVSEAKLKTVWDVDDYVQDGLVANYDGIKNAGKDNPHESTREEWVDLVSE